MYRAVTRNIEVSVEPFYMADRSDPPKAAMSGPIG